MMCVKKQVIQSVDRFKSLGVAFNACGALAVGKSCIERKLYAALYSLLVACSSAGPVKVQLMKSFCRPLLTYCIQWRTQMGGHG